MAPVCMALAAPPAEEEVVPTPVPAPGAPDWVGALVMVVEAETPEVNGVDPSVADEAPGNATAVVVGFGVAVAFPGLRTLDHVSSWAANAKAYRKSRIAYPSMT